MFSRGKERVCIGNEWVNKNTEQTSGDQNEESYSDNEAEINE